MTTSNKTTSTKEFVILNMRVLIMVFILSSNAFFAQQMFTVSSKKALLAPPSQFSNLGDSIVTPDALAIDNSGTLFISVPNFANYKSYGSKICYFNSQNKVVTWLDSLPLHPLTGGVFPMGLEFGPDGHLYIADAQAPFNNKGIGRLIRVIVKNGKPLKTEILVEGLFSANGLRWRKDRLYITDSYIPLLDKKGISGVYSFSLKELNGERIKLKAAGEDAHLVARFYCKDTAAECKGGADGLAFDMEGDLYVGDFNDGRISKILIDKNGKVMKQSVIFDDDHLRCCDGMFFNKSDNCIYLANFANNSVHRLNLNSRELELLWENEDANENDGLLDQPCEPIIYKGKLLVVNFDSFKGFKNTAADKYHTVSMFDLK